MFVKNIQLKNFKNYKSLDIFFDPYLNIFVGENGQGKTNLLESIYYLSVTKSFKNYGYRELIQFNEQFARIKADIRYSNQFYEIEVILSEKGKKGVIDNKSIKKSSEFIGVLNAVIFTPDDLYFIKGYPIERRKFIDIELSKISPVYLYNLINFNQLIKERNRYLKQLNISNQPKDDFLEVITNQISEFQVLIIKKRLEFIKKLNDKAKEIYKEISQKNEVIEIEYVNSFHLNEISNELIKKKYEDNYEKDIRRMTTSFGIHKDDIKIMIDGREASIYASQGQQRTIVLSLKIALLNLIKEEIGEYPVLLLDDVLSELDEKRQNMLLSMIDGKIQTFITTTSVNGIQHKTIEKAKKFRIKNGKVI